MSFLPIVARELRVSARKTGLFWLRVSAALAAILLGSWAFLINQNATRKDLALAMFGVMTGSTALYCLLSGVWFTADSLSQEKREGTLGLLFLTDLRGYDVVIGKMAATSLGALYGVLAVVPMLAVPLLIGGVAPGEFGRMALVILNTLFFSLTLGMCVSAMSRSGRWATMTTFLLIVSFSALSPLASGLLSVIGKWPRAQLLLLLPSPGYTFAATFDSTFKVNRDPFWWSLETVHGLGWCFLVIASLVAPRAWQDRPAGSRIWRHLNQWPLLGPGDDEERRGFRRRLLDRNAFFWLAARARQRPAYVWAALGLLALGWFWGLLRLRQEWLNAAVYILTALTLNGIIKTWVASESSRQLAEDRQAGTLELLLSTALSVEDILRGQWLALARQFLAPVLLILGIFFVFLLGTLRDPGADDERLFFIWLYSMGMLMLVGDLVAMYWLGMWRGLTAKDPHRAFLGNLVRILLLPWIGIGAAALFIATAAAMVGYEPGNYTFINLWVLFGLAADVGFAAWARHQLQTKFRSAATMRFNPTTDSKRMRS